jgi:two-component system, OmpR family, sensor histidine kinase AdeS
VKQARKPLSLKAVFALGSVFCVVLAVAFGYFGLTFYGDYQVKQFETTFSPAAKRAQAQIEARRVPSEADTQALMGAYKTIEQDIEFGQNLALVVLSMLAASVGAGGSIVLANRLVKPIDNVAAAAHLIAQGDLSARAASSGSGTGESEQLVVNFNQMATALEGFDREMSESSAAIAHELRTPLTVLRGYVQGAIDGVFPPNDAHMKLLLVHIESLSRVVDDLQTLSLAKNGALSMSVQVMDGAREVGTLLDALEPALNAAGITLTRDLQPAPMTGDPIRIRQAVSALIDNARNYGATGGVVKVETLTRKRDIIIRVTDRGPGLTHEQIERSFDRFWRGEPSRGKTSGGSGLGLSVVKAIAIAHGGRAVLTNQDGGGLSAEIIVPKAV